MCFYHTHTQRASIIHNAQVTLLRAAIMCCYHTHTHTHTHTHNVLLSHTTCCYHVLLSHTHTHTHTHIHTHIHTHSHSHTQRASITHNAQVSLQRAAYYHWVPCVRGKTRLCSQDCRCVIICALQTHTHTHTQTHTHTYTHTYTHTHAHK